MTHRFAVDVGEQAVDVRLVGPTGVLPFNAWSTTAPAALLKGVDLAQRLVASGGAVDAEDVLLVEHRAAAGLSPSEASSLNFPNLVDAIVHIGTKGVVTSASFSVVLEWRRSNGQPILAAERRGAFLRVGTQWRRLPDILFELAEAVDRFALAPKADEGERLAALAGIREVLPHAISTGRAEAEGLAQDSKIVVAHSFTIDLNGDRLVPVLHSAGDVPASLLLDPEQQRAFGEDQFNKFAHARKVYTLGQGFYLVLAPPLRRALDEVRRLQSAPIEQKHAFFANPRRHLREVLGPGADESLIDSLFVESSSYADRVIGLGLWTRRVVPWIKLQATDWFGDDGSPQTDFAGGLMIGDQMVPLNPGQAKSLRDDIEAAIKNGAHQVIVTVGKEEVRIPATQETLSALTALADERDRRSKSKIQPGPSDASRAAPEVLLIRPNEDSVDVEGEYSPRHAPPLGPTGDLVTRLKPHQAEGLEWLQKAWTQGLPGVLLADDMGLGKTIQGLAFLAWLRRGMEAGIIQRAPILVVAPTGLLQNWMAEHDRHLAAPGLGRCCDAFGRGLAALKRRLNGAPALDRDALSQADWILTTYETLRDYDKDFGSVRVAALLLDEAQKIKTPGVRLTDAAKAMKADFRIALTGTPVENRLSDLWCITDAVHPAVFGDLKTFSAEYERSPDADRLRRLKDTLDRWRGGRPPLMLRRLKRDRLPDLPTASERMLEAVMPSGQLQAYEAIIAEARGATQKGAVLNALHRLRSCSLHPQPDEELSDAEFIAASSRLDSAFKTLDWIRARAEKVLVFLDDLAMQARLVGIIQRRYGLERPPLVINGSVSGSQRQARVDLFQASPSGFDVMILSPQAGGVGLTLTAANHVLHLSRWWNPAVEDQCTGRVLRIGQTRPVHVHIPIAMLSDGRHSFDQNLHMLLERKRQLMRETLMPSEPTDADYRELFGETVGSMT